MSATHVDERNFNKVVLGSDVPVMVDFFAAWCAPCRQLSGTIEEIADENDGNYKVCKIDIDESPNLTKKYAVSSVPTVVVFKDGNVSRRITGLRQKDELLGLLS